MSAPNQEALREELTRCLRRTLVGPFGPDDVHWTSTSAKPTVVDNSFVLDEDRKIGPWIGTDGEEILDTWPLQVYTTGVISPRNTKLLVAMDDLPDDEAPDYDETAREAPDAADDDDAVGESIENNQSALSFSLRLPAGVTTVDVSLEFGTYSAFKVGGKDITWWHRRSHRVSITLDLSTAKPSHRHVEGPLAIGIGAVMRIQPDQSRLVTIWAQNESPAVEGERSIDGVLFQTRLSARTSSLLTLEPAGRARLDEVDLLYRDVETFAVGHGTDVAVSTDDLGFVITTVPLPIVKVPALTPDVLSSRGTPYEIGMDDLAEMKVTATNEIDLLISDYQAWIDRVSAQLGSIDSEYSSLAHDNIAACRAFLSDLIKGWNLVRSDPRVNDVFRDMSRAMSMQSRAYAAPTRSISIDPVTNKVVASGTNPHRFPSGTRSWRPFQIAFVLANLPRVVHPDGRRTEVDLIWMPTGGGKTEAYLGLAGFVILWTRKTDPVANGGSPSTKILMRYTYRLLTVQQLRRAAALICALETLREGNPTSYGTNEVRIGCWLGQSVTPNSVEKAIKDRREWAKNPNRDHERSPILTKCPWCGCEMGKPIDGEITGYQVVGRGPKQRILLVCPAPDCEFRERQIKVNNKPKPRGIPLLFADDEVYEYTPDFVVGTIDKVATMAWRPESGRLFGIRNGKRHALPPGLFIQDELHLITGTLGSLDAMYEAALEALCLHDTGRLPIIVASSATTRNYQNQITSLYGRGSRIVPPLGLEISDSFFSKRDDTLPGKTYVAVSSNSYIPNTSLQTRLAAALVHFVPVIDESKWDIDPYWTNVLFFSSRRALARLVTNVEDSLRRVTRMLRQVSGLSSGAGKDGKPTSIRNANRRIQITATSSDDVNSALEQLEVDLPSKETIDICYATSMIEVGLDVPRLGLMSVMGQPKSSSQYIQVTGRVGRGTKSPALIPVVLSQGNVRDLSHLETFSLFHQRLYASVEPASVTPFTYQALCRSARGCATIYCRVTGGSNASPSNAGPGVNALRQFIVGSRMMTPAEQTTFHQIFDEIDGELQIPSVTQLSWTDGSTPLILDYGTAIPTARLEPVWRVMRSMRNVDSEALGKILQQATPGLAPSQVGQDDDNEVEDL